MKLKLLDINEVTLETKDKLCKENISLVVDNTNITPENIKSGVSILGVNGTLQGGGGGNSLKTLLDATKSASYLFSGYTGPSDNLIQYNDTENVTDFSYMFYGSRLTNTPPLLNISKATSLNGMFKGAKLTDIPNYNTSNIKYFDSMFQNAEIPFVPNFDFSNGISFSSFLSGCKSNISISKFEANKGEDFSYMFRGTNIQEFPSSTFPWGENFTSMFEKSSIKKLNPLYAPHGKYFSSMFHECTNLQEIELKTNNFADFTSFCQNSSLEKAKISFTTINYAENSICSNMFANCRSLVAVDLNRIYTAHTDFSHAFDGCNFLKILIIRDVDPKYHEIELSTFSGCDLLLNGIGYVYVPRNQISILENETNWSYFSFRPLEDYTLDSTVDGEFDYDKVLNEVQLYTFTIDGVQFQADPGMTWSQWMTSSYNTAGVANKMGAVCNKAGSQIKLGNQVQRNAYAIVDGAAYTTA